MTPSPDELRQPDGEQTIRDVLTPFGWTLGPDFWQRYRSDPWVFNLVNAAARMWSRIQDLEDGYNPRLQESQEHNERLWRELDELRSAARSLVEDYDGDFRAIRFPRSLNRLRSVLGVEDTTEERTDDYGRRGDMVRVGSAAFEEEVQKRDASIRRIVEAQRVEDTTEDGT